MVVQRVSGQTVSVAGGVRPCRILNVEEVDLYGLDKRKRNWGCWRVRPRLESHRLHKRASLAEFQLSNTRYITSYTNATEPVQLHSMRI